MVLDPPSLKPSLTSSPLLRRPHTLRSQEFSDGSVLEGVDVLLLCTGYEYSLDFLSPSLVAVKERGVHPVYQHLFHACWPGLTFMGLLFSVVPFREYRPHTPQARGSVPANGFI